VEKRTAPVIVPRGLCTIDANSKHSLDWEIFTTLAPIQMMTWCAHWGKRSIKEAFPRPTLCA
jgi:hypothetical protein